jgi:hypothetical protein
VILFAPDGVVGVLRQATARVQRRRAARAASQPAQA